MQENSLLVDLSMLGQLHQGHQAGRALELHDAVERIAHVEADVDVAEADAALQVGQEVCGQPVVG